jgi:hypothetical protein
MLSEPRSIAFITECINPQLRLAPKDLQTFYSSTIDDSELSYSNFNLVPGGATLATVYGEAGAPNCVRQSVLAFRPDRIQVSEEWPIATLDDYLSKVRRVFALADESLRLPPFAAITTTARCLVGVQNMENSQEFLNKAFFRMDEQAGVALGRGTNLLGLRMAFPGTTPQEAAMNLRVESFTNDISSLFVEVTAMQPVMFEASDVNSVTLAMQRSYDFLSDNVMNYLTIAGDRSY